MNSFSNVIIELRSNNSRIFKESVLSREMTKSNDVLFKFFKYALDKLITFGIKNVPYKDESFLWGEPSHLLDQDFEDLLISLSERKLTGNAAKIAVEQFMNRCSSKDWNEFYRLILIKDLKCGVSEATINKLAKKYNCKYYIPVFSCQLAEDCENHKSKMKGEKIIQEKLDGVRILTVVYPNGRVVQYSRNGKEIVNFPEIKEEFTNFISPYIKEPMVFDGEIMSKSFQDLMSVLYKKGEVDSSDSILYLFDFLPLSEFLKEKSLLKQKDRSEFLLNFLKTKSLCRVVCLPYVIVNLDQEIGKKDFNDFNKKAIENGREGIMIKDPESFYLCKRGSNWLKMKPFITLDMTIIDIEEGSEKYTNMLGAFLVEGEEDGVKITTRVGTGFSDEQRIFYWENRQKLYGLICEIQTDAITKNKNGLYSLRFPSFIRLRGTEPGEKI